MAKTTLIKSDRVYLIINFAAFPSTVDMLINCRAA